MNATDPCLAASIRPGTRLPRGVPTIPGQWLRQLALDIVLNAQRKPPVIAVVGSVAGEGTTTVAVNLARVLEQDLRRRVLLIDACLHDPSLQDVYGVPPGPGLADILQCIVPFQEAVHLADNGGLAIMPAGLCGADEQSALLADPRLPTLLDQIRQGSFDVCLIDCPAALPHPETAFVARQADTIYCVLRAERTRWDMVERATSALSGAGCKLGGIVLNQVRSHIPSFLERLL